MLPSEQVRSWIESAEVTQPPLLPSTSSPGALKALLELEAAARLGSGTRAMVERTLVSAPLPELPGLHPARACLTLALVLAAGHGKARGDLEALQRCLRREPDMLDQISLGVASMAASSEPHHTRLTVLSKELASRAPALHRQSLHLLEQPSGLTQRFRDFLGLSPPLSDGGWSRLALAEALSRTLGRLG